MRICRFERDRIGVVLGEEVADVTPALDDLPAMRWPLPPGDAVIARLPALLPRFRALAETAPRRPLAGLHLESPVANPSKIIAAAANYPEHLKTLNVKPGELGAIMKQPTCLTGPSGGIALRFPDRTTVHETELAVIIGKSGTDIPEAAALGHVAGYAVALDITLRGKEFPGIAKSIDTYGVVGPWLVTPDEVPNPDDLGLELTVNGTLRQQDRTSRQVLSVAGLIAFVSRYMSFQPGDIIMMGNPPGAGPVVPGDVLVAEVERIGRMTVTARAHG